MSRVPLYNRAHRDERHSARGFEAVPRPLLLRPLPFADDDDKSF